MKKLLQMVYDLVLSLGFKPRYNMDRDTVYIEGEHHTFGYTLYMGFTPLVEVASDYRTFVPVIEVTEFELSGPVKTWKIKPEKEAILKAIDKVFGSTFEDLQTVEDEYHPNYECFICGTCVLDEDGHIDPLAGFSTEFDADICRACMNKLATDVNFRDDPEGNIIKKELGFKK